MRTPEPVVLAHGDVQLEPLSLAHVDDLTVAGQDPEVWRWLSVPAPASRKAMAELVETTLGDAGRVPWAVLADGVAVGSTSYLDIDMAVGGLEVGWTWYDRERWATELNPTCKLLLLGHAFDHLGAQRVTLKTDALNARSRQAILRLGATYDGTLRHHRLRADGSVRDSAYFSILAGEWSAVRAGLVARLAPATTGAAGG